MRVALSFLFFWFSITLCHSQLSLPRINTLQNTWFGGYSLGEGKGGSLIIEFLLDELGSGAVGIGGVLNARSKTLNGGREEFLIAAVRINYHPYLFDNPKVDVYSFGGIGYGEESISNRVSYTGPREESEREYTAWTVGVGIKYEVIRSIGVFAEASYGSGYITMGAWINTKR